MNRFILQVIVLLQMTLGLNAQSTYRAFYVSMAMGGSYLSVSKAITNGPGSNLGMKGPAIPIDLKIGYAFTEYFILSGDLILTTSISSEMKADGGPWRTMSGDSAILMAIFGVGFTYYFLPSNFFISGTIGGSDFSFSEDDLNSDTRKGFGFHLKLGKEWRISRKWNIGASMGFSYGDLHKVDNFMIEKLKGTAFGLSFNASRY